MAVERENVKLLIILFKRKTKEREKGIQSI